MKRAKPEYIKALNILLRLLGGILSGNSTVDIPTDVDWTSVEYIAEKHSLLGMLYPALKLVPDRVKPPQEFISRLREFYGELTVIDINRTLETELLLSHLTSVGVKCLPLKGYILRDLYPESAMRTMSDVDILYDYSDTDVIKDVFKSLGYTLTNSVDGDLDFFKEPFHHYEMHRNLVSSIKSEHSYFSNIWSKVIFEENSLVGKLTPEDFYIYTLEHLAKHLESGGAGFRMFMDIHVLLRNGYTLNREYLEEELKKINLLDFSRRVEELSLNWFSGNPNTDSEITEFVLRSCTYGYVENSFAQNAIRSNAGAKGKDTLIKRVCRRIFPSYKFISRHFPIVRKYKVLYPLCIFAYWFKRIFIGRNISLINKEFFFISADSDTAKTTKRMMDDLGLSSRIK